jgi:hypothetical protein
MRRIPTDDTEIGTHLTASIVRAARAIPIHRPVREIHVALVWGFMVMTTIKESIGAMGLITEGA